MLLKQTKIVASISDRRCDVDFIKELFDAGMNVVRMNTAHASREGFEALIANVRAVSNMHWIARRLAPPSSKCVAKEWRNVCGLIFLVIPAISASSLMR